MPTDSTAVTVDFPPLLDNDRTARILGIAPITLKLWRRKGRGPAFIRVGLRRVGYRSADIEKYLDANAERAFGTEEEQPSAGGYPQRP